MSPVYTKSSEYGLGAETTAGTIVDGTIGIPQEGLIQPDMGQTYERVDTFRGFAGAHNDESKSTGRNPKVSGIKHTWNYEVFVRLLASMHMTPGSDAASVYTITPAGGVDTEVGDTPDPYTLSFEHRLNAAVAHAIGGCCCSMLKLTFPASGGLIRMEYDLLGMTSDETITGSTMVIETDSDLVDLLCGDVIFKIGAPGSETQFYPEGDVVITFQPTMKALRRGENDPRQIIVESWGGSIELSIPGDATPDAWHDFFLDAAAPAAGNRRKGITVGMSAVDGAGDFEIAGRGTLMEVPSYEDQGIISEKITLEMDFDGDGTGTGAPYVIKYYDNSVIW